MSGHCQYPGIYRGTVTNLADPQSLWRIKAKVPQVLGAGETDWALPCYPPGGFGGGTVTYDGTVVQPDISDVLSPGQGVWIMFEGGDLSHAVWLGTWR